MSDKVRTEREGEREKQNGGGCWNHCARRVVRNIKKLFYVCFEIVARLTITQSLPPEVATGKLVGLRNILTA